ncbi:MAG: ATP phosphoribosyltransferase regulatory subunit, partial [Dehalococcoidia bacterium]|nr:ATP phosphoribosyltransferase regulatory subunit [Dehalococcoidia bacterium]
MKIQRCKGTRDLSTEDMRRFSFISEVFRDACSKYGYGEVKTPTIEYLHLFTSAGTLTPGMLGKVYSFLDWDGWSGERVVLKPDATIPVARLYIEQMPEKLAKLFYITNVFIFEETGKKTREKWQCGAELIGVGSPLADVELITLAVEVLNRLGLKGAELRLSHAGLTRGLLHKLALSPEEQDRVFDQLLDGDITALARIKTEKPELAPLLELQGKSAGFVKNLATLLDFPELKPQVDDFLKIASMLESLGYDYRIDMASARGFEYYTGVIFQLFCGEEKIGGGGRYDALIPSMGGKKTPASGFALYLDPLMNLIKEETLNQPQRILVRVEPEALKT